MMKLSGPPLALSITNQVILDAEQEKKLFLWVMDAIRDPSQDLLNAMADAVLGAHPQQADPLYLSHISFEAVRAAWVAGIDQLKQEIGGDDGMGESC